MVFQNIVSAQERMLRSSWPEQHSPRAPAYRPDIDGLRAIAVLSVVVFHARATLVPGGFAGVDVFFVISGYLITSIVHREIAAGEFSIPRFYERRIRRIYPALLATLAATLIAGATILMPDGFRDLGQSIIATVAFCSNILLWRQTDYFDEAAQLQPLLHTWSLAVEEQFYIVLPPLLLVVSRLAPRLLKPIVSALLVLSFGLSCAWAWIDPSGNYYLLHTRAWELLIGSVLALGVVPPIRRVRTAQAFGIVGLIALIVPFVLLHSGDTFPAWNAIPTCLGTAALIHTGRHHRTWSAQLLSAGPLVRVGLISYSVYLVHYPLMALTRHYISRDPRWLLATVLIAASLAVGWASWRYVEQPFRDRKRFSRGFLFRSAAAGSIALAALGMAVIGSQGMPTRHILVSVPAGWRSLTPQVRSIAHYTEYRDTEAYRAQFRRGRCFATEGEKFDYPLCLRLSAAKPNVVLVGDSHAAQYWRAIAEQLPEWNVMQATAAGCRPVLDEPGRAGCREIVARVFENLVRTKQVDAVILASRWKMEDVDFLPATYRFARNAGVPVVVIGPTTEYNFSGPLLISRAMLSGADVQRHVITGTWKIEHRMRADAASAGVQFVSVLAVECPRRQCRTIAPDRGPMQFDYGHLTLTGSRAVIGRVDLAAALARATAPGSGPLGTQADRDHVLTKAGRR